MAKQRVEVPPAVRPSGEDQKDTRGAPTKKYSRTRHTGIGSFSNVSVGTTASQVAAQDFRFPCAYVIADLDNTDTIFVGPDGSQTLELNPGDVVTYFDVSPSDIYARSESGTQKVYFQGHGDPES